MAAEIRITINSQSAGSGIADVKKDLGDLGDSAKGSGKGFSAMQEIATGALREIGAAAINLAASGLKALGGAISDGISDARENAKIQAQTAAVIKSTGSAAGVSAEHIADMASALSAASGKSLFGDDQIQQSENLLLTFTNIRGASLDAATAISVDLAQAMGGAPKDSAIQLGKALNDPIKGISALTRIGVTFTDEQKDMIRAMQETGDMAGAQKVILDELNKEFGGSAAAAAAADGGWAQFNDRMGEAKEAIGTAILPLLSTFAGILNDTVAPAIEAIAAAFGAWLANPATQAGIQAITGAITEGLGVAMAFLANTAIPALLTAWENLQPTIQIVRGALADIGQWLGVAIPQAIAFVNEHWEAFKGALIAVGAILAGAAVAGAILSIVGLIASLANPITLIIGAVALLGAAWAEDWGGIRTAISDFWTTTGQPIFQEVVTWLQTYIPIALQALADFWNTILLPALTAVWSFISMYIIPIVSDLVTIWFALLKVELQLLADFWNNILLPALTAVWSFISTYVIPIVTTLAVGTFNTLKTATQSVADFWNNILKPALNAVWTFLNTYVIPLFTALANVTFALVKKTIEILAAAWNNVLLPALNAAWAFVSSYLTPVFTWLNDNVLKPLKDNLQSIAFFILGTLIPQFSALKTFVGSHAGPALETLSGLADGASGAINNIASAVQDAIKWLSDLASKIASIKIPDWLEGHSPPPLANWFSDIGEAARTAARVDLPAFGRGLGGTGLVARAAVAAGDTGFSAARASVSNSTTDARTINATWNYNDVADAPTTDILMARSLAGV